MTVSPYAAQCVLVTLDVFFVMLASVRFFARHPSFVLSFARPAVPRFCRCCCCCFCSFFYFLFISSLACLSFMFCFVFAFICLGRGNVCSAVRSAVGPSPCLSRWEQKPHVGRCQPQQHRHPCAMVVKGGLFRSPFLHWVLFFRIQCVWCVGYCRSGMES